MSHGVAKLSASPQVGAMQKADEYQRHAQECRDLAATMSSAEHRDQLLEMAKIWEDMAKERETFVGKHPEFRIDRPLK
jgi:hypothetical protein